MWSKPNLKIFITLEDIMVFVKVLNLEKDDFLDLIFLWFVKFWEMSQPYNILKVKISQKVQNWLILMQCLGLPSIFSNIEVEWIVKKLKVKSLKLHGKQKIAHTEQFAGYTILNLLFLFQKLKIWSLLLTVFMW